MVECVVEFEYVGEEEDELSIKVGDVIKNVNKQDGGWWEGELNGKKGVFPDNFVKELKKERDKPREATRRTTGNAGAGGHVADLASKLGSKGGIKIGPPVPGGPGLLRNKSKEGAEAKRKVRAKASYSYNPENEDELKLQVGDVVDILSQEEEGWWRGAVNGKTGVFPSNFVTVMKDDEEHPEENHEQPEPLGEDGEEIRGKKVRGIGLGNIFGDGPIKLRSTGAGKKDVIKENGEAKPDLQTSAEPAQHRSSMIDNRASISKKAAPPVPRDPPSLPPKDEKPSKPVERAKVVYSYTAENEDELSLTEGDVIVILNKDLEDSGWWKGELAGKVGVFPDNFVELIHEEPKPRKPPPPVAPPSGPKGKHAERPPPPDPKTHEPPKPATKDDKPPPAKPAPSLPTKKPAMAPPVGRKPKPPPEPSLTTPTEESKAQDPNAEKDFEGTETSGSRLSHPTANRAQTPQRKPPSMKENREGKREPPSRGPPPAIRSPKEESKPITPTSPKQHRTAEKMPSPVNAGPTVDASVVEDLRAELKRVRESTVSAEQHQALRQEVDHLREAMEKMKTMLNKRTIDLMKEVDEEKKIRLNMKVEMDRLNKLVLDS